MNTKFKDLTGLKFRRLLVIKQAKPHYYNSGRKEIRWECKCKCDCGKITNIPTGKLTSKKDLVFSCGCYRSELSRLAYCEASFNNLIRAYKMSAKKRHIDFFLTDEGCNILFKNNCTVCGIIPSNTFISGLGSTYGNYIYNGIDRIDSKKHYTTNNTQTMCKTCNYAKNNLSVDDFYKWLKRIVNFNKNIIDNCEMCKDLHGTK